MTVQISVNDRCVPFTLDWNQWRWQCSQDLEEFLFPLITMVDGQRYELYSDFTFAEVER
jgi:hypothetical protein